MSLTPEQALKLVPGDHVRTDREYGHYHDGLFATVGRQRFSPMELIPADSNGEVYKVVPRFGDETVVYTRFGQRILAISHYDLTLYRKAWQSPDRPVLKDMAQD